MDHKSDLVHNHHTDDDLYVCLHLSELVGAIKCGKLTSRTRIVTGVATAAIFIVLLFIIVAEYVFKMKKLRKQDPSEQTTLDWKKRFQTIEGIAQGVLYLRKYSKLNVIHRDLKASNIPLDQAMIPKVSNIEMARIFGINQIEAKTNQVDGTYGYMSPEYALYGQFSEKSDVFNFGVLLLVANGTLFSIALDSPQPF